MPVAPVYEDGEAGAREDDVRANRPAVPGRDREIDPEPEPSRMKDRAEATLRSRVPAPVRLHRGANRGRTGFWNGRKGLDASHPHES